MRVVVAEDSTLLREGLVRLLTEAAEMASSRSAKTEKCCLRFVSSSSRLTGPSGATMNRRLPAPVSWSAERITTPRAVESMNVAPPISSTTTGCELAAPIVRIADSWGAAATSSSPDAVTRWALSSGSCSMR